MKEWRETEGNKRKQGSEQMKRNENPPQTSAISSICPPVAFDLKPGTSFANTPATTNVYADVAYTYATCTYSLC